MNGPQTRGLTGAVQQTFPNPSEVDVAAPSTHLSASPAHGAGGSLSGESLEAGLNEKSRRRILTGDRPTGRLHLGHWVGSLQNRVRLQDEYECFFILADLHTLTTRPEKAAIREIPDIIREIVLDYLAVGIDPEKSIIFVQSAVPETAELNLIFEMLVSEPRLERLPSIKDMAEAAHLEVLPFGLVGYPVLQAADILLPRADVVPVGKDNVPHVEITREIARRFNFLYGEVFPEPEVMVSEVASLPGIDGQQKMSKSLGNTIFLSDSAETVRQRVMQMFTDPNRIRADIPGRVEGNPVFIYHDAFNEDRAEVEELKERYRGGRVGDVEVKKKLVLALEGFLAPVRERRSRFAQQTGLVEEILRHGNEVMRAIAGQTMAQVRKAMGLTYFR